LVFDFSAAQRFEVIEPKPGQKQACGLMLVDYVVYDENFCLLVEVKDPSDPFAPESERTLFLANLAGLFSDELVPKARDTYTYLHLMNMIDRQLIYVVLIGVDGFPNGEAMLSGAKDRLMSRIRKECDRPWEKQYVADCMVVSIEQWNKALSKYPLERLPIVAQVSRA